MAVGMKDTHGKRLKFRIRGGPEDGGDIRLSDFITQLNAISGLLATLDRSVADSERTSAYYRIVDASHASPMTVTLEAVPYNPEDDYSDVIVDKFYEGLHQIALGSAPEEFDRLILEGYRNIAKGLDKNVTELSFLRDGGEFPVTYDFVQTVDVILGPDEIVSGSLTGALEVINVHGTPQFTIYPVAGPKKVICTFPDDLIDNVIQGLGSMVSVSGLLRYKRRDNFPYAIDITALDIYPPEESLPTVFDLRGIAPDATGGVASEVFIRRLRDASA
jgi:hypothetical protein